MIPVRNKPLPPDSGFTLLEVLVAMVIMAVTLVTLLYMQSGTIRLAGAGKFTGMIPVLTQRVLADQLFDPSGISDRSGQFGPGFEGLEWTCAMETVLWDDPVILSDQQLDRLKKIEVRIFAPDSGRSWSLTAWRYLVEPDD